MDFHPLVVHFPIALLVVYGLIEMFQMFPFAKKWDLIVTKTILLGVGLLGANMALQTGEAAAHAYRGSEILKLHESFASATYTIFGIIACIYLVYFLDKRGYLSRLHPHLEQIMYHAAKLVNLLYRYGVVALLAGIGLLILTGTGALGGALVYGPDPIANLLLSLFGI